MLNVAFEAQLAQHFKLSCKILRAPFLQHDRKYLKQIKLLVTPKKNRLRQQLHLQVPPRGTSLPPLGEDGRA